jgi:hypothetical protein
MAAIGTPYATAAQLETRLGKADDGSFAGLLAAASRHVNAFTGREFNQDDEESARRFRALDRERLPVNDFYTLTDLAVVVDGVAWDLANVDARPWDGIMHGEPGWPFSDLFAVGKSWPLTSFRRATIEVTAAWGWAAVPAGIIEATLDVAELMSVGGGVGEGPGVIESESLGPYTVGFGRYPSLSGMDRTVPRVLAKAAPYRRKRFGVA